MSLVCVEQGIGETYSMWGCIVSREQCMSVCYVIERTVYACMLCDRENSVCLYVM